MITPVLTLSPEAVEEDGVCRHPSLVRRDFALVADQDRLPIPEFAVCHTSLPAPPDPQRTPRLFGQHMQGRAEFVLRHFVMERRGVEGTRQPDRLFQERFENGDGVDGLRVGERAGYGAYRLSLWPCEHQGPRFPRLYARPR